MKYLAHKRNDGSDKPISIYDVIKGRKRLDGIESWEEGVIYYSLWYFRPMKAVVNVTQKSPHFAFIDGGSPGHHDGGGESIEHSLSKKIVSELKTLKVKVYGKSFEIPIRGARMENPEQFQGRKYRIDVMLQAEPCSFTQEYGSTLVGVEIKKSSRVKSRKQLALRNAPKGIVLLEMSLWDEITLDDEQNVEKLNSRLEHYWNKEKLAKCLHNPNYKIGFARHQENERLERLRKLEQLRTVSPTKVVMTITAKPTLEKVTTVNQNKTFSEFEGKGGKFKNVVLSLVVAVVLLIMLLFAFYR